YVNGISLFGQVDGALYSQAYSSSWMGEIFQDYRSGQIALRGKNNGIWTGWRTVLDNLNYNSYSPTLTGVGASGTWGINVTGNAATAGGLAVHAGTNNEANKIVRTDVNGYIQAGWINTISGDNGTTAPTRIYASSDGYIRYYTPTNFRQVLDIPTRTGGSASGTWGISITGNAATATNADTVDGLHSSAFIRADSTAGDWQLASSSTATAYSTASLELRESNFSGAGGVAPRLGLHWGGVVASQIGIESSGRIAILNNPGTGYENLIANAIYGTAFYYYSDKRLKENIKKIESPLEKIKQLNGYTFDWKKDKKKDIGVIAQEVEKVFPQAVNTDSKSNMKTVEYGNLVAPLIEAVKELANKIEKIANNYIDQQKKIDELKNQNAKILKRLESLEKKL
ncbi:MAG: tail fiber domain-containing protein, partial [Candidatus Gracilibacteria bacterium]|nr:tail fiber domain-containing protein [Candidatus Gracilibacteria bacterium]